ncbi:MAG TPA: hypothetical protein VGX23_12230 [Actinocrinis sp.]|nr:hypothetical protein [Actinocrinis sp.]
MSASLQGIKALVDDYDTYTYTFDTSEVEIEKIHGGTPLEPYRLAGSHWAVPILLPAALKKGNVVSMEFFTLFRNEKPLDPCFRYATHQRLENIMFRVEFHPDCLPSSVSWTEWRDYREPDDVVGYTRTVTPDRENAVVHHLAAMENAVAGFTWEF